MHSVGMWVRMTLPVCAGVSEVCLVVVDAVYGALKREKGTRVMVSF